MDQLDKILELRTPFNGRLYTAKPKGYDPSQPLGREGRFSGEGTRAFYVWRLTRNLLVRSQLS